MQTQKRFKLALWIVSGFIFLIGIIQVFSFLPGQLEAMKQAEAQGVAVQQISNFFWQQVVPQLLSYVMSTVAFIGILFSIGMLYEKIDCIATQTETSQKQLPYASQHQQENDMDTFFDDFEIVEDENKKEY